MARLKLNVASRPFVNTRPLNLTVGLALCALGVVTFLNLLSFFGALAEYRRLWASEIADTTQIADAEKATKDQGAAFSVDESKYVRVVSGSIAELIRKRQLSWSRLLDQLAAIVPADVRILSVHPSVQGDQLMLQMECVAKDHVTKREFYKRLNEPPFSDGDIMADVPNPKNKTIEFMVRCSYDPQGPDVAFVDPIEEGEAKDAPSSPNRRTARPGDHRAGADAAIPVRTTAVPRRTAP